MSKKISELPQYIGASQPTGDIPISIGGTTYKIDPSLLLQIKTIEGQTLIGSGDIDLTKSNVGLSNVDNTADIDKPISTATQTALNGKEDVSNKSSSTILGTSDTLYPTQKAVKAYVDSQTTPDATTLIKGKIKLAGDLAGTADAPTVPALANKVPYIGAISNVDLGEFGLKTGSIELDTTPTTASTTAGSIVWNDNDGTADLILKGGNVVLQIGQENIIRVVNKTSTNINLLQTNYQAVRVTGAQGQRLKVDLAQATSDIFSAETIGLVTETINNNQEGFVTTNGLVRGINTTGSLQGETWADGDILYLSPTISGQITKVKPIAPNHLIIIGYVIYAHATQGSVFVKVDNGYELDELHNVKITTPTENQSLIFTSSTNIWENKTIIEDTIINGITTKAPSQNAVFDALALKQDIITNPITGTGTGTTNKIAKFTGSNIIGDSQIFDNGTNVGIGVDTPSATLQVGNGTGVKNILVSGAGINLALGGLSVTFLGFSTGTISTINTSGSVPLGVGTRSTQPLILGTNNAERMRIDSSGNVGIGTTSPNVELALYQPSTPRFHLQNSTSGVGSTSGFQIALSSNDSYLWNFQNGSSVFATNNTEKMRITSSGNVGIGTTLPSERLEVQNGSSGAKIKVSNSGGGSASLEISSNASSVAQLSFTNQLSLIGGNVGIGTTTPAEKLQVSGSILCNRVYTPEVDSITSSLSLKAQGLTFMSLNNGGGIGNVLFNPYIGLDLSSTLTPMTLPYMSVFDIFTYMGAVDGMVVYNTDYQQIWAYTAGNWNPI